jgi:hypothetical protein
MMLVIVSVVVVMVLVTTTVMVPNGAGDRVSTGASDRLSDGADGVSGTGVGCVQPHDSLCLVLPPLDHTTERK